MLSLLTLTALTSLTASVSAQTPISLQPPTYNPSCERYTCNIAAGQTCGFFEDLMCGTGLACTEDDANPVCVQREIGVSPCVGSGECNTIWGNQTPFTYVCEVPVDAGKEERVCFPHPQAGQDCEVEPTIWQKDCAPDGELAFLKCDPESLKCVVDEASFCSPDCLGRPENDVCDHTGQCKTGLSCEEGKCVPAFAVAVGEACSTNWGCVDGAACVQDVCTELDAPSGNVVPTPDGCQQLAADLFACGEHSSDVDGVANVNAPNGCGLVFHQLFNECAIPTDSSAGSCCFDFQASMIQTFAPAPTPLMPTNAPPTNPPTNRPTAAPGFVPTPVPIKGRQPTVAPPTAAVGGTVGATASAATIAFSAVVALMGVALTF